LPTPHCTGCVAPHHTCGVVLAHTTAVLRAWLASCSVVSAVVGLTVSAFGVRCSLSYPWPGHIHPLCQHLLPLPRRLASAGAAGDRCEPPTQVEGAWHFPHRLDPGHGLAVLLVLPHRAYVDPQVVAVGRWRAKKEMTVPGTTRVTFVCLPSHLVLVHASCCVLIWLICCVKQDYLRVQDATSVSDLLLLAVLRCSVLVCTVRLRCVANTTLDANQQQKTQ